MFEESQRIPNILRFSFSFFVFFFAPINTSLAALKGSNFANRNFLIMAGRYSRKLLVRRRRRRLRRIRRRRRRLLRIIRRYFKRKRRGRRGRRIQRTYFYDPSAIVDYPLSNEHLLKKKIMTKPSPSHSPSPVAEKIRNNSFFPETSLSTPPLPINEKRKVEERKTEKKRQKDNDDELNEEKKEETLPTALIRFSL